MLLLLPSCVSHVRLCATPWTAAYQAPPSLGFSRKEYWSGLSLPSTLWTEYYLYIHIWVRVYRYMYTYMNLLLPAIANPL